MAKKTEKSLNLVSLFSGGGGLDIGLGAAGFKTLFANDVVRFYDRLTLSS